MCLVSLQQTSIIQQQMAKWHDRLIKIKTFQKDNWALLYDSRFQYFLGNFQTRWLGPCEVSEVYGNGTVHLTTIDGFGIFFLANGH